MPEEQILIILPDPQTGEMLKRGALAPAGFRVTITTGRQAAEALIKGVPPHLIIIGDRLTDGSGLDYGAELLRRYPVMPVLLMPSEHTPELAIEAIRLGFADYLPPPLRTQEVLQAVRRALQRRKNLEDWVLLQSRRDTRSLQDRINVMETIQRIGRKVTSLLELDEVLSAVVDASVELSGAEEGSLLLVDESTGELYMRAARNFQEDFVRTFRIPIQDSLAGQVLRTGKPLLLDEKTPQKIKTSYLVYTLIYVPLMVQGRVIGVLGVDNRHSGHRFTDYHLTLVSALSDYAAIAIENARLYSQSEDERRRLENILTQVEDGIIVIDQDDRILLVNRTAREAFGLGNNHLVGKPVGEPFTHPDLLEILTEESRSAPCRTEVALEDGRVFNTQLTPIPEVGYVITMQDITYLKELDRIKTDFVNTVSHDLRSPLTAILGYVELLDRVGPVTDQQREFIRRVQASVNSITSLINDLLELGRIEAGFDTRKEIVPLGSLIQYAVEDLMSRAHEKEQQISIEIEENLPKILGNPIRLRQMVTNLTMNAIKYTQPEGKIWIRARSEGDQVILQFADNGPGIPLADQPFIFDKFYQASNIPPDTPGTGLGLAIVKSIIDNHQGRIWVESTVGQGSIFTVVLPVSITEL